MPQINHTVFGGNLVRDPELRVTPKGTAVCAFTVANNKTWKDDQGNEKSAVTFLDCSAWGKTGEIIAKYFSKGSPIIVWGRLDLDQWEDKNTKEKRSRIKLTINYPAGGFDFCGKAGEGSGGGSNSGADDGQNYAPPPAKSAPPQRSNNPPPPRRQPEENLDEDVPF